MPEEMASLEIVYIVLWFFLKVKILRGLTRPAKADTRQTQERESPYYLWPETVAQVEGVLAALARLCLEPLACFYSCVVCAC